ncbi:MAG: TIGR03936 family radical SAM-associated protein [Fusobacteriaceae bacterium]
MKKRIYFNKIEEMKFISHLDLLRFFERVIIKSGIPIKYSQGFHPRPKLSFGNPISLGTESYNEIMELELEAEMENSEILQRFNSFEVRGFKVLEIEDVTDKISIGERFKTAIYLLQGLEAEIESVENLLSQETILEKKEKKGKIVERDLKDKIKGIRRIDERTIEIDIENGSPNSFLDIIGLKSSSIKIVKNGYRI